MPGCQDASLLGRGQGLVGWHALKSEIRGRLGGWGARRRNGDAAINC